MGLSEKIKKIFETNAEKERREKEIKELLRKEAIQDIKSREYKIYKEEERIASLPKTLYEKMCRAAGKSFKIQTDKKTSKVLQDAIDFSHLRVTPNEVASLTMLVAFLICFPTLIFVVLGSFGLPGLDLGAGMMIFILLIPLVYYLYTYPLHLKKMYEIETGSEIVTLILYMAMYMRNTPNLEGAVRFSAENLTGPLGLELKKLLWDVEVGNYFTMQSALVDYASKWANNKDFMEAIEILISSLNQSGERRIAMLDEAVNVILEGNRELARHYNQKLKMPVTIVHAMGIVLPIMGLVLFPIVAVFLGVGSAFLFIGYDIILPLILYFVIRNILEIRPATFSKLDISENPDAPPKGKFLLHKKPVSAWPFGFFIGAAIVILGILLFITSPGEKIMETLIIMFGIVCGISSYYILISQQNMKIRDETIKIENEFGEALFQLGNHIGGGVPIEVALESSLSRIGELKIKELFKRALNNMKEFGFTFYDAFFDKEYGAIRYYPSKLIKSVMKTVVEATKKGVETAAVAMLSVSRYLRGLHQTNEEVRSELNDTLNSLKFQAYFLSPFISGIICTMAIIIIRILNQLTGKLSTLSTGSVGGYESFLMGFQEIKVTPVDFILVVGVYLIETCFILSMFINGIENGEDPIGRQNKTGYTLIIGFIVFIISVFISLQIFGPLVTGAMTG